MVARGQAVLGLWTVCAALGCATVPPPSPGDPELRRFRIEGNASVSQKDIGARIVTEGGSWIPCSAKRYYDETILDSDLKRILRFYEAQGFYQARIVERRVTPAGTDRVDLTVRIDEGPPTLLRHRLVQGIPDEVLPRLKWAPGLREGERFKEEQLEGFKRFVAGQLAAAGYAEAMVEGQAQVDLATHRADVTVTAKPGVRYRLGQVFVAGAHDVPRERIAVEARTALPKGQLYSPDALAEAQRLVFDLGVFSTVRVTRGTLDPEAGVAPVVVSVGEAAFRTLRLAAGLALDPRFTELPRLSAEWTHRNFAGGLRRLSLLGEVSLVYLPSLWALFSSSQQDMRLDLAFKVGARFEQPGVIGRHTSLTATLGVERGVDPAFSYVQGGGSLGLLYRWRRIFDLSVSYNLSAFKLTGAAGTAVTFSTQQVVLDRCAGTGSVCRLAYLEQRATLDLRDHAVAPTRGAFFALSLQEGSRYLGGGYDYLRVLPEVRGYVPVGPVVLAARVQAGLLPTFSDNGSSVLTRFFLGGSTTERGFGNRQLSPSLVACRYRDPKTEACQTAAQAGKSPDTDVTEVLPVGGNGMLNASLEVRIPLPANLGLVVFADTGEVTPELSELSFSGINLAVGLGLRYRTVFGPVRLDAAYRVNNPDLHLTFAPDLPPGAQPSSISRFAVSFSIGEAF